MTGPPCRCGLPSGLHHCQRYCTLSPAPIHAMQPAHPPTRALPSPALPSAPRPLPSAALGAPPVRGGAAARHIILRWRHPPALRRIQAAVWPPHQSHHSGRLRDLWPWCGGPAPLLPITLLPVHQHQLPTQVYCGGNSGRGQRRGGGGWIAMPCLPACLLRGWLAATAHHPNTASPRLLPSPPSAGTMCC